MSTCNHDPFGNRKLLVNAGLDPFELAFLQISRYFFASFSDPERRHWSTAFTLAKRAWGPFHGPALATGIVEVLDAMRMTRRETFMFSNPVCPNCSSKISGHERNLMTCVMAARRGNRTKLNAGALMLFNGQEPQVFIAVLDAFIAGFGLGVLDLACEGFASSGEPRKR